MSPARTSPPAPTAVDRAATGGALVLRGVALNAVLAVIKIAAGVFGNTYALVADGVHGTQARRAGADAVIAWDEGSGPGLAAAVERSLLDARTVSIVVPDVETTIA